MEIRDKARLRAILGRDPELHVYELGDLDDRFWEHTRWFGRADDAAVALLYAGGPRPLLLALGGGQAELLAAIRDELPADLDAHLSPGLAVMLAPRFAARSSDTLHKMTLRDRARCQGIARGDVEPLAPEDAAEITAFLDATYPGHWFDARMLDTGHYTGVRDHGALVAVAGVHVYSRAEGVAALGNIAVAPDRRGQGLATRVTAATCASLVRDGIATIGLNVRADNTHAIAAYARAGFERVASYEEVRLVAKHFTADYVERAVLRDGTAVRLRLVAPEDKALILTGFERLSPESRYTRFLAPKVRLSDDELRYLTEIDHERHFAIGAVREDGDGRGAPIGLGIARFIRVSGAAGGAEEVAEAAIAVADEAQGQGLGKLLFLRLVAAAVERGITRFRCELLGTNTAMRELLRGIAPDATVEIGSGVMTIDVPLPAGLPPTAPTATAPPDGPLYRVLKAAAANALDWTDAIRRLWRR